MSIVELISEGRLPKIRLPEIWGIEEVQRDGSCFFHSVANGLNAQIKEEFPFGELAERLGGGEVITEFNAKLLRKICQQYAQSELLKEEPSWLKNQLAGDENRQGYVQNIGPDGNMWGDTVEARIICIVLNQIINDRSKEVSIHM